MPEEINKPYYQPHIGDKNGLKIDLTIRDKLKSPKLRIVDFLPFNLCLNGDKLFLSVYLGGETELNKDNTCHRFFNIFKLIQTQTITLPQKNMHHNIHPTFSTFIKANN